MKLWLLRPQPNSSIWEPWYDKAFGFVVRAETESAARQLAHQEGGDENRGERNPWLYPQHSTCKEITSEGEPGIVLRDFASA